MNKTVPFKQPASLAKPVETWVVSGAPNTQPHTLQGPTKRLTVDVPADLHRRLKVRCAEGERQISDVVRDLLEREYPAA